MATGELNEALSAIGSFGKTLRKSTSEYTAFIDNLERNNSVSDDRKELRERERNIKSLQKTSSTLEKLQESAAKLERENDGSTGQVKKTAKEFHKLAKHLKKSDPGAVTEEMMDSFKDLGDDSEKLEKAFETLNKAVDESITKHKIKASEETKNLKQTYATNFALKDKVTALKSTVAGLFSFEKGMTAVVTSLLRTMKEVEFAQQHQIGLYGGISDVADSMAYSMSLAPDEMQKFVAKNRALFLSMEEPYDNLRDAVGQTTNMMTRERDGRESLMDQAFRLTGTYEGAAQLVGTSMDILKGFGENVDLNTLGDETERMTNQFGKLGRMSGKTSQEVADMTARMLDSGAVRTKMMRLNSAQERKAMKDGILMEAERNKKLGISLEQTFALAEQSAARADTKLIDKITDSYNVEQLAHQVGMSRKDQERLGALLRDPAKDAAQTADMEKLLGTMYTNMKEIQGDSTRTGDIFAIDAMLQLIRGDTLGLAKTQGEAAELQKGKAVQEGADKIGRTGTEQFLTEVDKAWKNYAKPLIADPIVSAIVGLSGTILASMLPLKSLLGFFKGGKFLSSFTGGAKGLFGKIFSSAKPASVMNSAEAMRGGVAAGNGGGMMNTVGKMLSTVVEKGKGAVGKVIEFGKGNLLKPLTSMFKQTFKWLMKRFPAVMAGYLGIELGAILAPYTKAAWEKTDRALGTNSWDSVVDNVGGGIAAMESIAKGLVSSDNEPTTIKKMTQQQIHDGTAAIGTKINEQKIDEALFRELSTKMEQSNILLAEQIAATKETKDAVVNADRTATAIEQGKKEQLEAQNELVKDEVTWDKLKQK